MSTIQVTGLTMMMTDYISSVLLVAYLNMVACHVSLV